MRKHIPSKTTLIACAALFLSITGGATAAGIEIGKGSVTKADLSPGLQRELTNIVGYDKGSNTVLSYLEYCVSHEACSGKYQNPTIHLPVGGQ